MTLVIFLNDLFLKLFFDFLCLFGIGRPISKSVKLSKSSEGIKESVFDTFKSPSFILLAFNFCF
jgi:magnesium-transporting ATPase (P-type)